VSYYEQEVLENEAKLKDMQAATDKYDEYDIKRFKQVLDESYMMIPDSNTRCRQGRDDLQQFIEQLQDQSDEKSQAALQSEWYSTAAQLLLKQQQAPEGHDANETEDVQATNVDDLAEGEAF
jgi:tubulin-specific chaperone A